MKYFLCSVLLIVSNVCSSQVLVDSYPKMIDRIISSLQPKTEESVMIRYDSGLMPELAVALSNALNNRVNRVELKPYGPVENFANLLAQTDIYIWMPVRRSIPIESGS